MRREVLKFHVQIEAAKHRRKAEEARSTSLDSDRDDGSISDNLK